MRSIAVVLAATLLLTLLHARVDAATPFTVDHMLQQEDIGTTAFSPDGRYLVFERHGRFEDQTEFGRPPFVDRRSKLYVADLDRKGRPRPLFDQAREDGYLLGAFSPDGRRLSYLRTAADRPVAGIYDFKTGRTLEFGFRPDLIYIWWRQQMIWISETEIVYAVTGPERLPRVYSRYTEQMEAQARAWETMRRGRQPTASALGSGRHLNTRPREQRGGLVVADAVTGKYRPIGGGTFISAVASPDGRALAAVRVAPRPLTLDDPMEAYTASAWQKDLLIYDLANGGAPATVCRGCEVFPSIALHGWSPAGDRFVFFARRPGQRWRDAGFWVFDRTTGTARAEPMGGLTLHMPRTGTGSLWDPKFAWLGEQLAVLAAAPGSDAVPSWYLLKAGAAPTGLPVDGLTLVGFGEDALLMAGDGDVWSVPAAGDRRLLTDDLEPVRVVRGHRPTYRSPTPTDTLVLVSAEPSGGSAEAVILGLADGTRASVAMPSGQARVRAVSAPTGRIVYRDDPDNVGILSIGQTGGGLRELMRVNRHLNGVVGGTPYRIDHMAPDGQALTSWILLPPGYRAGSAVPTVVEVYPGSVGGDAYGGRAVWDLHALNRHILAGQGYAVLMPSIPVTYEDVPRDPLDGLAAITLSAVDAAIAAGYTDPDRLAIQGQSYGGYATAGIIGQTDRFKAAVATAGLYNLASAYGVFPVTERMDAEMESAWWGTRLEWAETLQGGMAEPPWRDVDRYMRNSPLMHVDAIDTPFLMMHGDLDSVSMTQAEEMFTALYRLNKDAVFVRYWGEGHVFNSPANIRDMWRRKIDWYDTHLRGVASPPPAP